MLPQCLQAQVSRSSSTRGVPVPVSEGAVWSDHTSVLGVSGRRIWAWEELGLVLLGRTLEGHQRGSCQCEGLQERPQSSASRGLKLLLRCVPLMVSTMSRACAVCPRELSLLSPEEDDGVLEGLDEFFAEDQVVVQKKKKSKKLKDGKAAKIKRRKKEVTLHFLTLGWGSSAVGQRQQLRVLLASTSWVSVDGKKGHYQSFPSLCRYSPSPGR